MNIERIMSSLEAKHPGESEYLQAVKEVLLSIEDIYNQHPEFEKAKIIERLVEPDRILLSASRGWMIRVKCRPTSVIAYSSTMLLVRIRAVFVSMPL